jgi:hypothetical protein
VSEPRANFSFIERDNEQATARALRDGNFAQAYLLVHALMEALLRLFLRQDQDQASFNSLILAYKRYLEDEKYPEPTFVDDLEKFNRRRNRIMHQLWRKGFSYSNSQAEEAARAAVVVYGLFIEWLQTFDPEITRLGFQYDDGA